MAKLSDYINATQPNTQTSKEPKTTGSLSAYISSNDIKPEKKKPTIPLLDGNMPKLNKSTATQLQASNDTLNKVGNTLSGAGKNWIGSSLKGITEMGDNPLNPLTYALGKYNNLVAPKLVANTKKLADNLMESGAQDISEAKQGLSKKGQLAVDLGSGAAQLAGDIALGAATGGGTAIPATIRSFGSGIKEAADNGGNRVAQIAYGTLNGLTTYFTNELSNAGIFKTAYGKGALDDIVGKAAGKAISKFVSSPAGQEAAKRVASGLYGAAGEGLENIIQDTITPLLQKVTYSKKDVDKLYDEKWLESTMYDGLVGAILGGVGGGVKVNPSISDNVKTTALNVNTSPEAIQVPTINATPQATTDTAKAAEANTAQQVKPEARINANLPNGLGATSNSFVPEQKTSKVFANTFQKTESLTDEQRAQMKPEDYQYDVETHAKNEAVSQQRVDVDFAGEALDLYAKQNWSAEDVFTSKKILDKFKAENDFEKINSWTKRIQQEGTKPGQTVEAFKAFQNTPEGAVIKAQQVIAEVEKKLTTKKELGKDVDSKKGREIKADTDNAKKAVKESADEAVNATNPANVAVEWWIRDTSKKLSDRIDSNAKDKGTKTNTTMQTMLNDLVRITKEAAPQGKAAIANKTAATDALRNYWANSEQYQGAVERAQRYINEKYANDPEALATFNDWLSGSGVNTWKLLGNSLQENGVKFNDILMLSWQDKAQLLDKVTEKILSDTDLTADEAKSAAQSISDKFYDELAARAQKKIETLLKPTTPKQQKNMYQKINEYINSGVFDDEAITALVKSKYGIPSLTAADVQKIYELNKMADETTDDYQQRVYRNRAARVIADKLPVTGKEKVLAVRRIAMLLNPKTLISRNAGGNVIFGLLEDVKDAPGTVIDILASKKTGRRTTSFNPWATTKAEAKGFKTGLVEWGKDIKNGVDTSPTQHEMPQASALKSRTGAAFESALGKLLQVGDRPFYEAAKAKRLDEFKRLGLDYTSDDAIADANTYALERVFQNNSELAKKAMQLRDSLGVIGDIAIPFAQTPANIFDKLMDYSPYGFVRAIKAAGTVKDSAWSQKQFVDTLSRATTGLGILTFAFFAAKNGLITGGDNKEEDEALSYQNKISGWQPYSVRVGDKSYTYDWSTVVGALLSLGADISKSESGGDTLMAILSNGAKAGINTMFNQSYMEGVADLFGSSSNGKPDIGKGLESMLVGLPASFTPTAFQQIAKLIDPIARDTYDSDPFKKSWNKVKAKLPFLSQTLPAKIGASGQPLTNFQGSKLSNAFESVISPGYIGETQKTAIDSAMQKLYEATGDSAVLPKWSEYTSKSDLSFTGNGTTYTMTPKEWETYQKTRGQYSYKELNKLTNSSEYKAMTDEEKAKAVTDIYSEATANAKQSIVEARGEIYIPNASAGAKIEAYQSAGITQKQAYSVYKTLEALTPEQGEKTVSNYQKVKAISGLGYSDKQAIALVGTLYTTKDEDGNISKESMLPYLTTSKHLLSLYLTNKDNDMVSMAIPSTFTEKKVEYELTDKEKELFKTTYANYFNGRVTNVTSAQAIKTIRDKAYDAAKLAVIRNR